MKEIIKEFSKELLGGSSEKIYIYLFYAGFAAGGVLMFLFKVNAI